MHTLSLTRLLALLVLAATPSLVRGASPGADEAPPANVGAYLQAGAALNTALTGRHGVTREHLPGCIAGLELRPEHRKPFNASKHRTRVHDDGLAYAAGDSIVVTGVEVTRHEIHVLLGLGGYDPDRLEGRGSAPTTDRQRMLEWQIRVAAAKEGIPTTDPHWVYYESLTDQARETRVRELEARRGEAIKAGDDARLAERQMMRQRIARVAGSRIRLVYDHDIPLADLTEPQLRLRLAPYLTLAD